MKDGKIRYEHCWDFLNKCDQICLVLLLEIAFFCDVAAFGWGIWYSTLLICVSSPTLSRLLVSTSMLETFSWYIDRPCTLGVNLRRFFSWIKFTYESNSPTRLWLHCNSGSIVHCLSADCRRQSYSRCLFFSDSAGEYESLDDKRAVTKTLAICCIEGIILPSYIGITISQPV